MTYKTYFLVRHCCVETSTGVIENASESAPGPDGEKYSDLKTLNCQELHCHTDQLTKSLAEKEIPEEWLDSRLAQVPKPDKDCTSIKGYRIVTMQNITRNVSEKLVARRLSCQSENDNLLPSTLGSNRVGKDTRANAAVIASEVYDVFKNRD